MDISIDNNIIALMHYLVTRYRDTQQPDEILTHVLLPSFLLYLDTCWSELSEESDDICQQLRIPPETWDNLVGLLSTPDNRIKVLNLWWVITTWGRKNVRDLKSVHTSILLRWDDDVTCQLSGYLSKELLEEGMRLSDGLVCLTCQRTTSQLIQALADEGLERLYADKGTIVSDRHYDVLMGLLQSILDGASITLPGESPERTRVLSPEDRQGCMAVMRQLQALFRPLLDKGFQELLKQSGVSQQSESGWE